MRRNMRRMESLTKRIDTLATICVSSHNCENISDYVFWGVCREITLE